MEDEQDQVEDKHRVLWESQELEDSEEPEASLWSESRKTGEEEEEEQEEVEEEAEVQGGDREMEDVVEEFEIPRSPEREEDPWESSGPDEGTSQRQEETEYVPSEQDKDLIISDSEDGAVGGQQDFMQTEGRAGLLYTPDTDASKTSDAEVPPSYSKAVSFDRLEVSDDESDNDRKRRMIMTSDSHSDSRSDIVLPSMTTELTASDLLLNK